MKKEIFWCMDFDTNHPKLIIAAVAYDRNGLTNEAAAFSVRLSAFLFGAPRRCIKIKSPAAYEVWLKAHNENASH